MIVDRSIVFGFVYEPDEHISDSTDDDYTCWVHYIDTGKSRLVTRPVIGTRTITGGRTLHVTTMFVEREYRT